MTRDDFRSLKEGDVIVLNNESIEAHKYLDVKEWGASIHSIDDLRNKLHNVTKLQVDNCCEVAPDWFMIKFYTDGIVSKDYFNRPFACIAENLCVFFDKIK